MTQSEQSELLKLKRALAEEKAKSSILEDYSRFGLWEYHIADDTFFRVKNLFGETDKTATIKNFHEAFAGLDGIFSEDLPDFGEFCSEMRRCKDEVSCEVRVVRGNSETARIKFEGKLVRSEDNFPVKYVGRLLDITDEAGGHEALSEKLDPLTEAYNPDAFRELVEEKRKGTNRYSSAGLFSVAIDNFRELALNLGPEYSDYLQKCIAKILVTISVREKSSFAARVRDGEFSLFFAFDEPSFPENLARRIIQSVKNYIFEGDSCTVSIGLSTFKTASHLENVYSEAATALSEAQRSGGNCFMSYSPAMSVSSFKHISEINRQPEFTSMASGASMVYALILQAFCANSDTDRMLFMKEAFKTAGDLLGASNIYIYCDDHGKFLRYMTYNSSGDPLEICPRLRRVCTDDEMKALLKKHGTLRVHQSGEQIEGLALANGAVFAEARAIINKGEVCAYFSIVFNSSFELDKQDVQIIDTLENALTKMFAAYKENVRIMSVKRFHEIVIGDHRIEGFSIIPGEFRVETVQEGAREHYGLEKGDLCYKKVCGRDKPCDDCPAHKLDKGELYAASAQYVANDRRWLNVAASIETNINGERRYFISSTDITDCLGKIKMSDSLTGLMTLNVFSSEALRLTNTEKDVHRFIAVINVADFHRINDEKGYETGDGILITAAEMLGESITTGELLCRSEGSRFIVLFKSDSAEEFSDRLRQIMLDIQKQVLRRLRLTIFLVAGAYDIESDTVGIMGGIDRAIRAQKTVRDRAYFHENLIAFFDEALREKIQERRYIEANMFSALENNEFQVFYQPKISIETGRVVGAEALARWIRPNGEVISPGKFVPIFEENGFITDMDFAVYRNVVADISRWLRLGIDVPLISINVSRHHIGDDNFCGKLNSLIDSLGVPHKYIELEITESLLTGHLERLIETASWFKERGYRISVDDFGSGYSSLNLITMLPFDTLKIDGGFFLKNDLTEKNRKVITSVVTLAKSLNLETVSEGVETQTQVDFLKELGCDMIQGFFYYKPMPCNQFEQLLNAQTNSLEQA